MRAAPLPIDLAERRRVAKREALMQRISSRVPERLDRVEHPGGHVWQRNREHEANVLRLIALSDPENVGRRG